MGKKSIFLVYGVAILLLIAIIIGIVFILKTGGLVVFTDKREYNNGQTLIAHVQNTSTKDICFSFCYPYYLEKKSKIWQTDKYGDCPALDVNENCMKSGQTKAFEFTLSGLEPGMHRLEIPVCVGCQQGNIFEASGTFHSNDFIVN